MYSGIACGKTWDFEWLCFEFEAELWIDLKTLWSSKSLCPVYLGFLDSKAWAVLFRHLSSWLDWTELQGQCAMENPQYYQLVVEKKVLAIRMLYFEPHFCSFQGAKGSKGLADWMVGEDS